MERGDSLKADRTSDPLTLFERVTLPTPKEKPNEPRESPLELASRSKRMATPALKKELNEPRPPMPGLPDDVLGPVFNHLSMRDLESAGCVSRDWCRALKKLPHWPKELKVRKAARRAATCVGVISLCERASAAVDADGRLCVWGKLGTSLSYTTPTIVQTARVKSVSTGIGHILVLTTTGEVLSFGSGWYGRLGHGDEEDQLEPKVIEALRGTRVVAIAVGRDHSMVQTDKGKVLSFGSGSGGQLGHGDYMDRHEPEVINDGGETDPAIAAARRSAFRRAPV